MGLVLLPICIIKFGFFFFFSLGPQNLRETNFTSNQRNHLAIDKKKGNKIKKKLYLTLWVANILSFVYMYIEEKGTLRSFRVFF